MPKTKKRITRAMKIEMAAQEKRKHAQQRAEEARMKLDNPENVATAKELILSIRRNNAIMLAAGDCDCEHDCYCSKNYYHAECKVEQDGQSLRRFAAIVIEKAEQSIKAYEEAVVRKHEEIRAARLNKVVEDHGDIWDVFERELPNEEVSSVGYCDRNYTKWEREICTPALMRAGYKYPEFSSHEADSFGPLIRKVTAIKDNVFYTMFYG